ncbi:MAG: aminotransferase class V-fold PLP-dependent enzyme [Candidatus Nanohalobium sp.]
MEPEKIREDFPIFQEKKDLIYLDNAATTQKPGHVIERVEKFYREENANIGRGLYDLSNTATQKYEDARRTVADFINASAGELVFTRNTTEAVNLVASSLELDGNIVLSEMAHHSEQLPWRRKAEREGLELDFIPTEEGRLDIKAAEQLIDQDTALISISHISNIFGRENPVKEIVKLAEKHDAYVFLDGAQSVPRKPVDVKKLGIDFMAFSGHKMLGPTGIGALYGRRKMLEKMKPYQLGGGMVKTVSREDAQWKTPPQKFEAGTQNMAGATGMAEAVQYLKEKDMEEIYSHEKQLNHRLIQGLKQIKGVKVFTTGRDVSVVSFSMEKAHPHDIAEILSQEENTAVRAGKHCAHPQIKQLGINGTVRASPYLYNTKKDIQTLLKGVRKVKNVFS